PYVSFLLLLMKSVHCRFRSRSGSRFPGFVQKNIQPIALTVHGGVFASENRANIYINYQPQCHARDRGRVESRHGKLTTNEEANAPRIRRMRRILGDRLEDNQRESALSA